MVPPQVRAAVEAALEAEDGDDARVTDTTPVGGGCVSAVAALRTESGRRVFLKWSPPGQPPGLLEAEARGLALLAATGTVRTPAVLGLGDAAGTEWLLTEWLEPGSATDAAWKRLGGELAGLHRHRAERFGDDSDNYIGTLPQSNGSAASWPEFWWTRRLEPQLRRALDAGPLPPDVGSRFARLSGLLPDLLAAGDREGPSLLHGDLWSGNVHTLASGGAALIDPSAYHGHREVDLAMAELFGGPGASFHHAYRESWPLEPGYAPARRAVYQLYYLLVHVNLFGAGYVTGTLRALSDAGA